MIYRFLIIVFSLSLTNCYIYKPMEKPEISSKKVKSNKNKKSTNKRKKKKPVLLTKDESIKGLKEDVYYKINTIDKSIYKIRYKKSDTDSIYGHKKNREDKSISIAKNDIKNIKDRRFSKLNSDLITFPILGGLAVGLLIIIFN